jgi:hypothetical protein
MVFVDYPTEGIDFLLGLVWLCNTPPSFNRYVIEPKGFVTYLKRGTTHAVSNCGHNQYPSKILEQYNSIHGVYKTPS